MAKCNFGKVKFKTMPISGRFSLRFRGDLRVLCWGRLMVCIAFACLLVCEKGHFACLFYKELFPVVVAAHLWGSLWSKKHMLFLSDNEAVVAILSARTPKVPVIMHLLRDLLLSAARWGFSFSAAHVPGVDNKVVDAISRFHWQEFRRLAPEAQAAPCTVRRLLLDSLIPPC